MVYCFLDCEMITDINKIFQISLIFTDMNLNILEIVHYNIKSVKLYGYVKMLCKLTESNTNREFKEVLHIKTVLDIVEQRINKYDNVVFVGKSIQKDLEVINSNRSRVKQRQMFDARSKFINLDRMDRISLSKMAEQLGYTEEIIAHRLSKTLKKKECIKIGHFPVAHYNFHNSLFDAYASLLVARVYRMENLIGHIEFFDKK